MIVPFSEYIEEAAIVANTGWVKARLNKVKKNVAAIAKRTTPPTPEEIDTINKKIVDIFQKAFIADRVYVAYNPNKMSSHDDENEVGLNGGYTAMGDGIPVMLVYVNKNLWQSIFTENNWKYFIERFSNIIGHEQVHRVQYARAKLSGRHDELIKQFKKPNPGQTKDEKWLKYLSNKYEIQAWATQAVLELMGSGYTNEEIIGIIRKPLQKVRGLEASDSMLTYFDAFDNKTNHPVMKRYLKFMYQIVTSQGRP